MSIDWDEVATREAEARGHKTSYPGARAPARFRERVLAQLVAPANVGHIESQVRAIRKAAGRPQGRGVAEVAEALRTFARGAGKDAVASDPLALRGRSGGAAFWSEVRRLNSLFLADIAPELGGGLGPEGKEDDDGFEATDDISRRIFEKTILRPPGREHLNGPGPLWQLRERQGVWNNTLADGGAAGRRGVDVAEAQAAYSGILPNNPYRVTSTARGHADAALRGKTLLTPSFETAGAGAVPGFSSDYDVADPDIDPGDRLFGMISASDSDWHRSGSEFDRWRGIPVWQKAGRRSHDTDIEETLGLGDREHGGMFRRFDMGRLRAESMYREGGPMLSASAPAGPDVRPGAPTLPIPAIEVPIGTVPPGAYHTVGALPPVAKGARLGHQI